MKLEDIKKCITCSSTDFQYEPALEIDWTEDDTTRVVEAKRCLCCDDVYFIQEGCMARQFIPNIKKINNYGTREKVGTY